MELNMDMPSMFLLPIPRPKFAGLTLSLLIWGCQASSKGPYPHGWLHDGSFNWLNHQGSFVCGRPLLRSIGKPGGGSPMDNC